MWPITDVATRWGGIGAEPNKKKRAPRRRRWDSSHRLFLSKKAALLQDQLGTDLFNRSTHNYGYMIHKHQG
jgi:hypothetical protein